MEKDQIILLEQLFNRYFSHLVLYSRKLIGAQEPAEDIVQDVFLHLFESKRLKYTTPSFLFTSLPFKNSSRIKIYKMKSSICNNWNDWILPLNHYQPNAKRYSSGYIYKVNVMKMSPCS